MEQKTPSVCEQITAALENEKLPENFSLPDAGNSGIRWAPGAMDGVAIYHMGPPSFSAEEEQAILSAVQTASQGTYDEAYRAFLALGQQHSAYSTIDVLQNCIIEHKNSLNLGALHGFAVKCLLDAPDIDLVKFGMEILEIFTDPKPELKKVIFTLGLYDEFTIFALFHMQRWPNANAEIFRLARAVHGWGRVHAVECLEPQTQEIRDWLLHEGAHNAVMPEYSALTCFVKSDAAQRLKGTLSDAEFASAGFLFAHLFEEGPVAGISALPDARETILDYLAQAAARSLSSADCDVIKMMRAFAGGASEPDAETDARIIAACDRLLCTGT